MAIIDREIHVLIHSYLVRAAANKRIVTYEEIFQFLDWPNDLEHRGLITAHLTTIFNWCKARNIPGLTVIVVRKSGADQGLPGKGFWDLLNPNNELDFINLADRDTRRAVAKMLQAQVFKFFDLLGDRNEQQGTPERPAPKGTEVRSEDVAERASC